MSGRARLRQVTPLLALSLLLACERPAEPPPSPRQEPPPEQAPKLALAPAPAASDASLEALPRWDEIRWRPIAPEELEVGQAEPIWEAEGLELSRQPWRSPTGRGLVWRVRLPRGEGSARVMSRDEVVDFEEFIAPDQGPRALINGGFYEPREGDEAGYRAMGLVRSSGQQAHDYVHRGGSGIFLVHAKRGASIVHRSEWDALKAERHITDALQSIDRLVDQGEVLVKAKQGRLAARSAVALTPSSIWLVVAAEEASIHPFKLGVSLSATSFRGLSLYAFAAYLADALDATEALNLDGAVSTQLFVSAGARRFEVRGERGTINAIELRPAP